jgi:pyridoxine/pyridoxamine 5'-phosphate oxidase
MTPLALREFLRKQAWAVESTSSPSGHPQSAVIGIAVTDALELIFDTRTSSRKHQNLERDARIALVVGWDDGRTAQIDGIADRPTGPELARVKECYFARFPDGRDRASLPDMAYWCVQPHWIRFSDFNADPPTIVEWDRQALEIGN